MSVQYPALARDTIPNKLPNIIEFFDRTVVKPIRRWHHRRKAVEELQRLDDRLLADIGIIRGEIDLVVDEMLRHDARCYAQPPPHV